MEIEVISSEKEAIYVPSELVRMVPTMEELSGCVTEWRDGIIDKGLEVNTAKSIVMLVAETS